MKTKNIKNSRKIVHNPPKVVKTKKRTKLALTIATCITALTMQPAFAVCSISPNDSYEYIRSITLIGSSLSNGVTLKNGDILALTPGYNASAYKDDWSVWIDLNNDGDFSDTNELVFTTVSPSNTTVSAALNIPSSASENGTKMRVVLHSGNIDSDSCNFRGFGDNKDFSVNVGDDSNNGGGSDYYALTKTPRGGSDEHILSVDIENDNHTSGNNNGYADFTNDKTFSINDGDEITLTANSFWQTDWAVWIDSDENGSFDSNEKVFSGSGAVGAAVEGTADLSGITSGTKRMRIAMNGDGSAEAEGFTYGEIEDYSVNVGGNDGGGTGDIEYGPDVQWQHDNVHVKVYRFEFTDVDLEYPTSALDDEFTAIQNYFDEQSYGRFSVTYEIIPGVIDTGTKKSTFDDHSSWDWVNYYKDTLVDLGEDLNNKTDNTIYMILSPQLTTWDDVNQETVEWGPKGGPDPGAFRMYDTGKYGDNGGGMAHEMGHAMGLHHAEAIDGDGQVFGTGDMGHVVFEIGGDEYKEKIGYGNIFGMMGNNAWDFGGLNLYYKNFFAAWDIKAHVPLVTKSDTYKIFAHDQGAIKGDIGIRLAAGNGESTYWVEYRSKDGANTDGVQINIAEYVPENDTRNYYYDTSYLLDMTPGSITTFEGDPWNGYDMRDAELVIGKSYTDKWNNFTIKTVGKGIDTIDGLNAKWIEVEVIIH